MPKCQTRLPQSFTEKQFDKSAIQVYFGRISAIESFGSEADNCTIGRVFNDKANPKGTAIESKVAQIECQQLVVAEKARIGE
ncbi:hypothetical protein BV372_14940 [Nostoc sp. T09]|uniref:hypothetical protein n=1 Tax=Nostoc sp. T09 TaxID=1932621 RepID=UPI000A365D4D|nr:hypothetical protein [Nostoc sp. T09]OUL34046.1 hypothetical protein BV372_14940 [Nostoc sp. T09]